MPREATKPELAETLETTRVCEIRRIPNPEHMHRCVQAIRAREHPLWSWNGFRVTGPKMRRVK